MFINRNQLCNRLIIVLLFFCPMQTPSLFPVSVHSSFSFNLLSYPIPLFSILSPMSLSTIESSGPQPCKSYIARIKQELSDIEDVILDLLLIPHGQPSMSAHTILSSSLLLYYDEDRTTFYNNVRAAYRHLCDQWMALALIQLRGPDQGNVSKSTGQSDQKTKSLSIPKSSGPQPCKSYLARIKQEMSDIEDIILDLLLIPPGQPSMPAHTICFPSLLLYYDEDRTIFHNNVRAGYNHLRDQWMNLSLEQLNPDYENALETLHLDAQKALPGKEIKANKIIKAKDGKSGQNGTETMMARWTLQEEKVDVEATVRLNEAYQLVIQDLLDSLPSGTAQSQDLRSTLLDIVRTGIGCNKDEFAEKSSSPKSRQGKDGCAAPAAVSSSHFWIQSFPLSLEFNDDDDATSE